MVTAIGTNISWVQYSTAEWCLVDSSGLVNKGIALIRSIDDKWKAIFRHHHLKGIDSIEVGVFHSLSKAKKAIHAFLKLIKRKEAMCKFSDAEQC